MRTSIISLFVFCFIGVGCRTTKPIINTPICHVPTKTEFWQRRFYPEAITDTSIVDTDTEVYFKGDTILYHHYTDYWTLINGKLVPSSSLPH